MLMDIRLPALLLTLLLVSLSACTKSYFKPTDPTRSYEPTAKVDVYRNYPDTSYIEIGTLRVIGRDKDKLLAEIREQARQAGAEAIVVKPAAVRTNEYVSSRRREFGKLEYILEAIALRYQRARE